MASGPSRSLMVRFLRSWASSDLSVYSIGHTRPAAQALRLSFAATTLRRSRHLVTVDAGRLTYVDAGHGYWLVRSVGEEPRSVEHEGGLLVGIDRDMVYTAEECPIARGDRVVLYSDGLVEQRSPDGEQLGQTRVREAMLSCKGSVEDVDCLLRTITEFAGRESFDDDTTIASVEVMQEGE